MNAKRFIVNDQVVSEAEFNQFLQSLDQIETTWYCAETGEGGIVGYQAKGPLGEVYQYSDEVGGSNEARLERISPIA